MKSINARSRFTIHFATINTKEIENLKCNSDVFTIHFATINTQYMIS